MEKSIIGDILKKRISEMGKSQEEFSENTGIAMKTLRTYMDGKSFYRIDVLEIFANELNCSYDYLLGYSKSPKRENMIIAEELGLSDDALEMIKKRAENVDDINSKKWIETLDIILKDPYFMEFLASYFMMSRPLQEIFNREFDKMTDEEINVKLEQTKLILVSSICTLMAELRAENNSRLQEVFKKFIEEHR